MQSEQKQTASTPLLTDLRPIETAQDRLLQTFTVGSDVSTPITANNNAQIKASDNVRSLIAKGIFNYQELIECENDLEKSNLLLNLAPPDLVPAIAKQLGIYYQTISQRQQEADAKLNSLDLELSSTDLWSFPILSKRTREDHMEPLIKGVESLKDQIDKLGQSVELVEERGRERAKKAETLKEELARVMREKERIAKFEARLQELDLCMNDEEDNLERNISYQSNFMTESKKSHKALQDLELPIKSLNDGLVPLRKETVKFTDLGPALKIQADDHLNVQNRLISLIDEKQVIVDKQIRQFSQDFNRYFLEFGKTDPVAEALNAFEADIFSAVDQYIDEQKGLIEEVIRKNNNETQQYLEGQMDLIEREITSIVEDLPISDSNVA
ncbi:hypothetical protein Clacol_006603 [Clathrus columnatus]|uniref:Uncharacterized protein n=1 Tax=Clathrus columnatus TaxID=1419009 RepID=A0AAV5ACI3_9AGAM|nr:hypothetical protein Clacol_006603 [Clathrus columnatus]